MTFPSREFDDAVAALCHGTISDELQVALHELLLADQGAQEEYLWRVELHGELAAGNIDASRSLANTLTGELEPIEPPISKVSWGFNRTAAAWAAVLVLSLLSGWLWLSPDTQTSKDGPRVVARFAHLEDSQWMNSTTVVSTGDAIRNGQRIELSSGSAELRFNSGARLRMIGPTIVELLSDNSAFLLFGNVHVVADLPEAKGFTLNTRTSTFIDIGTAFSVSVSPDDLSRLEVTEGEVDVVIKGIKRPRRVRAGEKLLVEPGDRQIITRIEQGDGTKAFRFPTIAPPSREDYADQSSGHALIRVVHGQFAKSPRGSAAATVLLDGVGQAHSDSPRESAFFENGLGGFLVDLGQAVLISNINTYSWHQHRTIDQHRNRAQQQFTLYGYSGDELPDLTLSPGEAGWTRIARVNSDRFFEVRDLLDRPAQQACSIAGAKGSIGRFRYLLWEVRRGTFYGEFDVFASPSPAARPTTGE